MCKLAKVGVAVVLSLMLALWLLTASVSAQSVKAYQNGVHHVVATTFLQATNQTLQAANEPLAAPQSSQALSEPPI